ncbi:MAG TPA: hypothetical protein VF721_12430 [Pyrinomonadaceae bacterium]|jgi:hypothetical protein
MKRNYIFNTKFALICAIILTCGISIFGQKSLSSGATFDTLEKEIRPFDFNSRYYYDNGIEPGLIVNRRNGNDGLSVLDSTNDERFRGVRLTAVYPAYNQDGKLIYWNLYGELYKQSFRSDRTGGEALSVAEYFPMYIFPSDFEKDKQRQASVIDLKDNTYFDKNPLGLSVQVEVRFAARTNTDDGQNELALLAEKNGLSLDGTPLIRTVEEIQDLTRKGLVVQTIKGLDNPSATSYVVGKVIEKPEAGAITPDAFLVTVQSVDGERFHADISFIKQFNCLKNSDTQCDAQ